MRTAHVGLALLARVGTLKGQVIDLWQDGLEHGTFGWPLPPVLISNIPVVVGRGYEGVAHEGYVGAAR